MYIKTEQTCLSWFFVVDRCSRNSDDLKHVYEIIDIKYFVTNLLVIIDFGELIITFNLIFTLSHSFWCVLYDVDIGVDKVGDWCYFEQYI